MNQPIKTPVLAGYLEDARGAMIPIGKVKPIDKLRDETVRELFEMARVLRGRMESTKEHLFQEFQSFVELSANEYDVKHGGAKGNITLLSFDGSLKIQIQVSDNIQFDERLQVAKKLIDECLHDWSAGANDNLLALINSAFAVDKEGNISTGRVLGLRRLDISDEKWERAMTAITDSVTVTSSKEYMRFYERLDDGSYESLSLDFAAI